MKRLSILAILVFYTIASFGISVNYFYCCGKLKSVSITSEVAAQCKMPSSKKCCENQKILLKVSTDQKTVDQVILKVPAVTALVSQPVCNTENAVLFSTLAAVHFTDNSPPPLQNRQVLFCSFRI